MSRSVSIGEMADAIMEGLTEYADLAAEDMKKSVKKAGNTVRKEIQEHAPKDSGTYSKSWSVKNAKETANSLEIAYYVINNNMGYDGDLELAMIPESFRTEALKEQLDDNGVLIENADVELASFALLFEFDGDQKHIRHVLYNCAASRPGIEGKTNEDSREVQTETLTINATPLSGGMVKAKTGNTTSAAVYNNWYKAVYMPTVTPDSSETEESEGTA